MEPKKLQMSINPIKAPEAYELVKRWEVEAGGEKGYENKKIQEVLAAWSNLMEMHGVTDTMKLAMLLARGTAVPASVPLVQDIKNIEVSQQENDVYQDELVGEEDPNEMDYMALLANAQARAENQRKKSDSQ